jgi:hypothetical protein
MTETQPRPIFEGSVSMANPFSERRYCSSPRPLSLTAGTSLSNASRLGEERANGARGRDRGQAGHCPLRLRWALRARYASYSSRSGTIPPSLLGRANEVIH